MEDYTALLANILDSGASLEVGLAKLQRLGASPVDAIKAIRATRGIRLSEAKEIFSLSPAWAREVAAGDILHEEIISALSIGQKM
jgi:ribosomal protein L7/L12